MDIFNLLGLRGTRTIVIELSERGGLRYSELVKVVGFSTTATRALKGLEGLGLIKKRVLAEPYRPVLYTLTEEGLKLAKIIKDLQGLDYTQTG